MSSNGPTYVPPFATVTETNRGGELLITNIIGLIIAVASVILRVFISSRRSKNEVPVYNDDILCFAGLAFCIVESGLVWAAVVRGNGKDIDLISPKDLEYIQKMQYAIDIFYVISLLCSRASVLQLYRRIQSAHSSVLWRAALAVQMSFAFTCLLILTLKCNLSMPWIQYNVQCTGLLARWQAIEILNILTECAIFALSVYLVSLVRMRTSSKVQIVLLFASRAIVIAFSVLRLTTLPSYLYSSNPTYAGIPAAIWAIAQVHASLVTATTPLLKSFIVQFGVLGAKPVNSGTLPRHGHAAIGVKPRPNGNLQIPTPNQNKKQKQKQKLPIISTLQDSTTRTDMSTWSEDEPWVQKTNVPRTELEMTSKSDASKSESGSTMVRTRTSSSKANSGSI